MHNVNACYSYMCYVIQLIPCYSTLFVIGTVWKHCPGHCSFKWKRIATSSVVGDIFQLILAISIKCLFIPAHVDIILVPRSRDHYKMDNRELDPAVPEARAQSQFQADDGHGMYAEKLLGLTPECVYKCAL